MGPNGEILLDYSVFDAKRADFDKVVFIIKKAIEKDFREVTSKRIENMIDVDYAFQEIEKLPSGFTVPNEPKSEFFMPTDIDNLIKQKGEKVSVLKTDENWFGVTYKEDADYVRAALKKITDNDIYNGI